MGGLMDFGLAMAFSLFIGTVSGVTADPVAPASEVENQSNYSIYEEYVQEDTVNYAQEQTYVLNTNSKKFHYPSCSDVKRMSEKNKSYFTGDRDSAISRGYSPCKNCNP